MRNFLAFQAAPQPLPPEKPVAPVAAALANWPWIVRWVECGGAKQAGTNSRTIAYDLVAYLERLADRREYRVRTIRQFRKVGMRLLLAILMTATMYGQTATIPECSKTRTHNCRVKTLPPEWKEFIAPMTTRGDVIIHGNRSILTETLDLHTKRCNVRFPVTAADVAALRKLTGVQHVYIADKYAITVEIGKAFRWDEVEEAVMDYLRGRAEPKQGTR